MIHPFEFSLEEKVLIELTANSTNNGVLTLRCDLVEPQNYRKQRLINKLRILEACFKYYAKTLSDPRLVAIALTCTYGEQSVYEQVRNCVTTSSSYRYEGLFAVRCRHHYLFVEMKATGFALLRESSQEEIFQEAERLVKLIVKPDQKRSLSRTQHQKLLDQLVTRYGPSGNGSFLDLNIRTWVKKRA